MGASSKVQKVAADTQEQLLSLREQVESLLNDRVTPAISDAAGKAETAVHSAKEYTASTADDMSKRVRGRPLIAIGVSAAIGYLLGRIAR